MPARTFILGGTRSGKSTRAVAVARERGGERVTFLATARPDDTELEERIAQHRRHRPAAWPTLDVGTDLAGAVTAADPSHVLLLDSLTLWVATLFEHRDDVERRWHQADRALSARATATIVVS